MSKELNNCVKMFKWFLIYSVRLWILLDLVRSYCCCCEPCRVFASTLQDESENSPSFFLQSSVWKRSSDSVSLSCCPAHCSCCIWAKKWWFDWLKFDRLSFCSPCKVYVLCPFLFFAFLLYNSTQTNCSVSIAVMHLCCCRNFVDSLLRVIIIIVYILACLRQCSYS